MSAGVKSVTSFPYYAVPDNAKSINIEEGSLYNIGRLQRYIQARLCGGILQRFGSTMDEHTKDLAWILPIFVSYG